MLTKHSLRRKSQGRNFRGSSHYWKISTGDLDWVVVDFVMHSEVQGIAHTDITATLPLEEVSDEPGF